MVTALTALGGLVLLYAGGEGLVRGASSLAVRFGLSPLVVGLTVVAFGTSAPELVVSLSAALGGANDIALGNVVGSNVCNVALVLGVSTLLWPARVEARLVRLDGPLVVLASALLLAMLATGGGVGRVEGAALLAGLALYVAFTIRASRRESRTVREEFAEGIPPEHRSALLDAAWVALGLGALVIGGHWLVSAAVEIATELGMEQAVIGITIVAVGTSLPEIATSLIASARGQGDIAVGNVVGSNLFNLLGILGATAAVEPLVRGGVRWADLGVMLGTTLLLLPMLVTRRRLDRLEGAVLVAVYLGYTSWLLFARGA